MTLSPINQKYIQTTKANNANTASVNVAPKVNVGQPQDSVELSTNKKQGLIDKIKANKKILIPTAIGIAALAGGVIYGIKTGKISFKGNIKERANEIIEEGNKIKQRGAELVEEAQKQYDEVLELIKKGEKNGKNGFEDFSEGSKLIKFSGDELEKTIREYEGDKLLREADFELFGQDYRITTISKNIEDLEDGTEKIKELFAFKNDKIEGYYKNATINKDDSVHYAEGFTFKNDKIRQYFKNITINKDGSGHFAEVFAFKNDKIERYYKNYKINANHKESWEQKYIRNEQGELVKA